MLVPSLAADISKAATGSIYALMLLLMMYLMPDGIWGSLVALFRQAFAALDGRSAASTSTERKIP